MAYSQSLLAVYPTGLSAPGHPLVSGLLARMERSARPGLPANKDWLGLSGVWPGESMDGAEIYLLRGDTEKAVGLLLAALNHSYTTKDWKEEILVDKTFAAAPTADAAPLPRKRHLLPLSVHPITG